MKKEERITIFVQSWLDSSDSLNPTPKPKRDMTKKKSPTCNNDFLPKILRRYIPMKAMNIFETLIKRGRVCLRDGRKPSASSPAYKMITLMPESCWKIARKKAKKIALELSFGNYLYSPSSPASSAYKSFSF